MLSVPCKAVRIIVTVVNIKLDPWRVALISALIASCAAFWNDVVAVRLRGHIHIAVLSRRSELKLVRVLAGIDLIIPYLNEAFIDTVVSDRKGIEALWRREGLKWSNEEPTFVGPWI